jgi:hypothetical protein
MTAPAPFTPACDRREMDDKTPPVTPGQVIYEAGGGAIHSYGRTQRLAWADLPPEVREGYEGGASAVASHLAATVRQARGDELTRVKGERDQMTKALRAYERITTAWTRGMYAAWIDCVRGDVRAAIECLSEGLDGYDGTAWNGTETGAEWWERTKAEEGL